MADGLVLKGTGTKKGLVLDPRTKIFLLIIMSVFSLGGAGGEYNGTISAILSVIPIILLIGTAKWKSAFCCIALYSAVYAVNALLLDRVSGLLFYILLIFSGIFGRFLPCIVTGYYTVQTTTVSEFISAMERMHVTEKITIPFAVMFRFFPTVSEEMSAIKDAMDMRGISIGGKHSGKFFEYRMIPLMICSVKIGEELSAASLTRCLGGPVKRTNICKIGFHFWDYAVFLAGIASVITAVATAVH